MDATPQSTLGFPVTAGSVSRRGLKRKCLAATLATLATLALAEVALRVLDVGQPSFMIADEHLGYRLRAGAAGKYTAEGDAYVHINSHGWRDHERTLTKPEGSRRIAVLGDSYAEARQVEIEHTFWSVLERLLNNRRGANDSRVEVLNFGVSGFSTIQEFLTFRHYTVAYDPDVVLLAMTVGNDVRDNSRELSGRALRPYMTLDADGTLTLDRRFLSSRSYKFRQSWIGRSFYFLLGRSYLARFLNDFKNSLGERPAAAPGEVGLDHEVYRTPEDENWAAAWSTTEAVLIALAQEVRNRGAQLRVLLVSNGIQVHPDADRRQEYCDELGVADLHYPNERVVDLCRTAEIPVLDLVPVLSSEASRTGVFFHGFGERVGLGHWNEVGHERAARAIAEWLDGDL